MLNAMSKFTFEILNVLVMETQCLYTIWRGNIFGTQNFVGKFFCYSDEFHREIFSLKVIATLQPVIIATLHSYETSGM